MKKSLLVLLFIGILLASYYFLFHKNEEPTSIHEEKWNPEWLSLYDATEENNSIEYILGCKLPDRATNPHVTSHFDLTAGCKLYWLVFELPDNMAGNLFEITYLVQNPVTVLPDWYSEFECKVDGFMKFWDVSLREVDSLYYSEDAETLSYLAVIYHNGKIYAQRATKYEASAAPDGEVKIRIKKR